MTYDKKDIIKFEDFEIDYVVSQSVIPNKEGLLWLTQKQIAELFEVTIPNINMHIKAIYKEEELFENRTIQKYLIVQQEGNREVKREIEHYNLDVIVANRLEDTLSDVKEKVYTRDIFNSDS